MDLLATEAQVGILPLTQAIEELVGLRKPTLAYLEVYDKAYPFLKEGTLVKATLYKNRNKEGYACSMVELL